MGGFVCELPLVDYYVNSASSGYENGIVQASSFRTYHTPLNRQVGKVSSI